MRKDAERNLEKITTATRELLAMHDGNVSMETIATRAGVAVGTLYRHYPTKADLISSAIDDAATQMAERGRAAEAAVAAGADPYVELVKLFQEFADHSSENRALGSAARSLGVPNTLRPDENPPLPESPMGGLRNSLDRLLDAARAAGSLRTDVTRLDLSVLVRGVFDFELDCDARRRCIEIIFAGLRPPQP
jgi:AcrR family transcriptional regulator